MGTYTKGYAEYKGPQYEINPIELYGMYEEIELPPDVYQAVFIRLEDEGGFPEEEIDGFVEWGHHMDAHKAYDEYTQSSFFIFIFWDAVDIDYFTGDIEEAMKKSDEEDLWEDDLLKDMYDIPPPITPNKESGDSARTFEF